MTEQEPTRRQPGRPRKSGGRRNTTVRFTDARYATLQKEAQDSGRSVSEVVEARVEQSFGLAELLDAKALIDEGRTAAIKRAEAAAEELRKERNWAVQRWNEALQHVEALQQQQKLDEEMIERVVERAFAKMKDIK
jgi:hypothetical protein